MILAIILFVISLIEHRRGQNVEAKWLFVLGGLAFCAGAYMAWHDADAALSAEIAEYAKLKKQVETSANPNFLVSFPHAPIISANSDDKEFPGPIELFWLSVINRGAPSIARIQDLAIHQVNGSKLPIAALPLVSGNIQVEGSERHYPAESEFGVRAENTIPTGSSLEGWIALRVLAPRSEAAQHGSIISVTVIDFNNKPYFACTTVLGKGQTANDYPPCEEVLNFPRPQ